MNKARSGFPRLWQRVFMYAILLVLASHLVSFAVFRFGIENNMYVQILDSLASSAVAALEGKDRDTANVLAEFFSTDSRSLWVEGIGGERIAGEVRPGFGREQRQSFPVRSPLENVRHLETGDAGAPYLAAAPVNLVDGCATLYLYLGKMPPPPMSVMFVQGLIAVCVIGGALSVWTAWRIARPLRKLRSEVLDIAGGNLEARVGVTGSEEVCQVAEAVNSMAKNLADNIVGMRELVANISHEMRSPLARMSFSMAIIEEGVNAPAQGRAAAPLPPAGEALAAVPAAGSSPLVMKHIGRMVEEITQMESLVGSCLLSSKLDLQQQRPKMADLDLSRLCEKIASRYETDFKEKNLLFSKGVQRGVLAGGDEELLSLMLGNLLDNALKYTAHGGRVRLSLCGEGGEALLSLENSHEPIADGDLPNLFLPFYRRPDAGGVSPGVGLGLSLVRKIAALHGGSVTAENSEAGLRFVVRLPGGQAPSREFLRWFFERHSQEV